MTARTDDYDDIVRAVQLYIDGFKPRAKLLCACSHVFGCDLQLPRPGEDVAISINCKCTMCSSLCQLDNAISSMEGV